MDPICRVFSNTVTISCCWTKSIVRSSTRSSRAVTTVENVEVNFQEAWQLVSLTRPSAQHWMYCITSTWEGLATLARFLLQAGMLGYMTIHAWNLITYRKNTRAQCKHKRPIIGGAAWRACGPARNRYSNKKSNTIACSWNPIRIG